MKTTTTEVVCDGCGKDLSVTHYEADFRLVLGNEAMEHDGSGTAYAMRCPRPIDRTHHFCGMRCLEVWLEGGVVPERKDA